MNGSSVTYDALISALAKCASAHPGHPLISHINTAAENMRYRYSPSSSLAVDMERFIRSLLALSGVFCDVPGPVPVTAPLALAPLTSDPPSENCVYTEALRDWLEARGCSGLENAPLDCACPLEDLIPCGMPSALHCRASR